MAASFAFVPLATLAQRSTQVPSEPTVSPAEDLAAEIAKLSKHVRFGFLGLGFFQGRLFVSCNVGLLEFRDAKCKRVPLGRFSFAHIATVGDATYMSTDAGDLLRVTPSGAKKIETPGDCEAITATSSGNLLASFSDKGLFVYADGWTKLLPYPYPPGEGEHRTHLAESEGRVAYATKSVPHLIDSCRNEWYYSGTDALWIANGEPLQWIEVPVVRE